MEKETALDQIPERENEAEFVSRWQSEIDHASSQEKAWKKTAKQAVKIYRAEDSDDKGTVGTNFNILYSNTQTLSAAVFNQTPKPDVRRRYRDENDTGKEAAEVLERALLYSLDMYDFERVMKCSVHDGLLAGRGVPRIDYDPTLEEKTELVENEEGELVNGEPYEIKTYEEVRCEPVYWEDLRIGAGRSWEEVPWVAFRHLMKRSEIKEEFGAEHSNVPLKYDVSGVKRDDTEKVTDIFKRACVWEIWDKEKREVIFIAEGYDRILSKEEDPLNLMGFFPIPKPFYAISSTASMVPVCLYSTYQKLAEELNKLTGRITSLTKAVKNVGIYDKVNTELATLLEAKDTTMIPAQNFTGLMSQGGLQKAVEFLPVEEIARVLLNLQQAREQVKQTIFEVSGISDIMRGQSKASETATAQRIKGNFGTLRVQEMQRDVQRMARDIIRMKAEVIAENFDRDTLTLMTGKEVTSEVMEVLRSDMLRTYNIDIETDSTIAADEAEEQETVTKLLSAVAEYVNAMAPHVQSGLMPLPAAKELLMVAVRRFKGVRAFEDTLEQAFQQGQQLQGIGGGTALPPADGGVVTEEQGVPVNPNGILV